MTIADDIQEQARSWFIRLSDVDAPVSAWLEFQDWLEQDETHRLAYDDVERLWVELDDAVSPAIIARVAANDAAPVSSSASRKRAVGSRRPWLIPVAGIAAALAVSVGVWPQLTSQPQAETYRSEAQPRAVELSDGSQIYLNRHSSVSVTMKRDRREVRLADGEAAFDVAHDTARPFVVSAGDRDIRVLGTAFNVLHHDGRFSVGVARGVVAVTPSKASQPVRLVAGQKINQVGSQPSSLSSVDPASASSWRDGVLIYRNATIGEVASDLSRYFNKPVIISPSAQPSHFTGALRVGDEATMLDQLQAFVPVRTVRSATEIRLTARDAP